MTVDEAFKEIERRLTGAWGRADFTVGNDGVAHLAPEIIPPGGCLKQEGPRPVDGCTCRHCEALRIVPRRAREKTAEERKTEPIYSGVLKYFPDALAAVARVSKAGNDKHNPGQPLHWSRGKSSDQMDANTRHILAPDHIDPEVGEPEINLALWRLLAQVQLNEEKRNRERGIRSYSGL